MSNDKKITVELTVEQAMAVIVELPYKHKGEPELAAVTQAMESALASHREEQERASLGTPWVAVQNCIEVAKSWRVYSGGQMCDPWLAHLTEPQARLMSAAPELADALAEFVALEFQDDVYERARLALKKAGRR